MSVTTKAAATKDIDRVFNEGATINDTFSNLSAFVKLFQDRLLQFRKNIARFLSLIHWMRRFELIGCVVVIVAIGFLLVPRAQAWESGSVVLFGFDIENSCQIFKGIDTNTSDEQILERAEKSLPDILWYIDANYQQQEVLSSLLEKALPDIIQLYRTGHILRQRLLQTLFDNRIDDRNLGRVLQEITSHNERTSDYIVQLMAALSGILAQEQLAKILECVTSET